jgi:hypothetical protein
MLLVAIVHQDVEVPSKLLSVKRNVRKVVIGHEAPEATTVVHVESLHLLPIRIGGHQVQL